MTEVALRQAEKQDAYWDTGQRDCAGFIRYVYKNVFRSDQPLWRDRSGRLSAYLRAEELIGYNFHQIEYEASAQDSYRQLRTGDVLVYYNPSKDVLDSWHLMLVLFPNDKNRNQPLLIYHNGARDDSGSIRKIWWDSLFLRSWSEWRPDVKNPFFRGVYRWNRMAPNSYR